VFHMSLLSIFNMLFLCVTVSCIYKEKLKITGLYKIKSFEFDIDFVIIDNKKCNMLHMFDL